MTKREKRDHWAEQAVQAFLLASVCAFGAMLLGVAGLLSGPPLAGVMLRIIAVILALQCGLGVRMIYCIVKHTKVGSKRVRVEEHSGDGPVPGTLPDPWSHELAPDQPQGLPGQPAH